MGPGPVRGVDCARWHRWEAGLRRDAGPGYDAPGSRIRTGHATPSRSRLVLLAQLVAKKKTSDPNQIYAWYNAYFDVLTHIGWVVQDQGFAEYHESSDNFEAHRAILAIATTLLGSSSNSVENTL